METMNLLIANGLRQKNKQTTVEQAHTPDTE